MRELRLESFFKRKIRYLALIGLPFLAVPAYSEEAPGAAVPPLPTVPAIPLVPAQPVIATIPPLNDLQVSELSATFLDFQVGREGQNPALFTLYGRVFQDCAQHFEISNSQTDPSFFAKSPERVGFRITDRGGLGRSCMERHQHDQCDSSPDKACLDLNQLRGGNLRVNSTTDVSLEFAHHNPSKNSLGRVQWQKFDPSQLASHLAKVKGTDTILRDQVLAEASEALRREQLKQAHIDLLFKQAKGCRKTSDDRQIALAAVETLGDQGLMQFDEVERLRKEIRKAELRDLSNAFMKAKSGDDSGELDDAAAALVIFAEENPDQADTIVSLFHQKAVALTQGSRTPQAFDRADALLQQARELSGTSERSEHLIKEDLRGIRVGRLQAQARNPKADPYELMINYSTTLEDLSFQAQDCYMTRMNANNCGSTFQALGAVSKVPQIAQQTQWQQYMFQVQLQQQLMSAYGQFGQNPNAMGTPGVPGASGMMMPGGMNMMGQNPMGGGGSPFFQ